MRHIILKKPVIRELLQGSVVRAVIPDKRKFTFESPLYVRENWAASPEPWPDIVPQNLDPVTKGYVTYEATFPDSLPKPNRWMPSVYMPQEIARLWVDVVGAPEHTHLHDVDYTNDFQKFWAENYPRQPWDSNPLCWVLWLREHQKGR
jgi:hypothetical protein